MSGADGFPPVEALVPHRGRALFIREVLEGGPDRASCLGRIPADSPFVSAGLAPCLVGIDMAAQAAAAMETLLRRGAREDDPPDLGYLVGIREARFETATLPAGTDLTVYARPLRGASALAVYEVELRIGPARCLSAVLTIFRPPLGRS